MTKWIMLNTNERRVTVALQSEIDMNDIELHYFSDNEYNIEIFQTKQYEYLYLWRDCNENREIIESILTHPMYKEIHFTKLQIIQSNSFIEKFDLGEQVDKQKYLIGIIQDSMNSICQPLEYK